VAASDAHPWPIKGAACRITVPILDADGDLVTGATGLDSEVSKDAGTFTDCTNEATEIATSSGMYYLDLTAAEMSADTVAVIVKTSTSGAKTTPVVLYPVGIVEPSGVPSWPSNVEAALGWLLALARNKMTQTAAATVLRNAADSANVGSAATTDDGTTLTRGGWA
jgi:hypothetical protein